MAGERLFEYSLDLCDYVVGSLRWHLRDLPERPTSAPPLHPTDWDRLVPGSRGRRTARTAGRPRLGGGGR
jgi:hypothetical protein